MKAIIPKTKSYSSMVEMLCEVEALMIAMKIDPNNIVDLIRAFQRFIKAIDNDDGEEAQSATSRIKSLRNYAVKKATK